MQVHDHPEEEERGAEDKLRRPEPGNGIGVGRREEKEPTTLHDGIEGVEQRTGDDDGDRHLALSLHQQREDERSLEIVELEKGEHHAGHHIERFHVGTQRDKVEYQHREENRALHDEPAYVAANRHAPAVVERHAVGRGHKLQHDEHHNAQNGHHREQNVVKLGENFHNVSL